MVIYLAVSLLEKFVPLVFNHLRFIIILPSCNIPLKDNKVLQFCLCASFSPSVSTGEEAF